MKRSHLGYGEGPARSDVGRERLVLLEKMARRTSDLAEKVLQAHAMGFGPGQRGEPWSAGFQRQAVDIYFETLPVEYELGVAVASELSASAMQDVVSPGSLEHEWRIMHEYMSSFSAAIRSVVDDRRGGSEPRIATEIGPVAPAALRIDLLAEMASAEGMRRLGAAASRVASYLSLELAGLTLEEVSWLDGLARGERVLDIAVRHNISVRGLHRDLVSLWTELGVENSAQGIALASRMGWLDEVEPR